MKKIYVGFKKKSFRRDLAGTDTLARPVQVLLRPETRRQAMTGDSPD